MMKKVIAAVIVIILAFGIFGCISKYLADSFNETFVTNATTDAIAITHSSSDAPGWYLEGKVDPEYMWVAPIKGKFVPVK